MKSRSGAIQEAVGVLRGRDEKHTLRTLPRAPKNYPSANNGAGSREYQKNRDVTTKRYRSLNHAGLRSSAAVNQMVVGSKPDVFHV